MRSQWYIVALLLNAGSAFIANAQESPADVAAIYDPVDEDGIPIIFLDDARKTTVTPDSKVLEPDKIFTYDRAAESLAAVQRLWTALGRVHDGLYHESNLRSFDADSGNPYTFQGNRLKQLPDEAHITWSMGKTEFMALELPDWESIHLGAINHQRFLEAYADYKEYKTAHLQLALLDAQGIKDGPERELLEKARQDHKRAVIKFLKSPPAD